jgi:hypothetical protein
MLRVILVMSEEIKIEVRDIMAKNRYKHTGLMIMVFAFIAIAYIYPSNAIPEQSLTWSTGDVYTLTPSNNMATEGNYTIKLIDFPGSVRGTLSVNDTIIPISPVTLAVTIELYKDMINNPNPIATFTLQPGDEYITSSQDLRITIDSMPGEEDADWVYESYNPQANIRIQQAAAPDMNIQINFADTNGDAMDIVNPGDTFLVNIDIQNTGDDVAKDLVYSIAPDPRLQSTPLTNKLHGTISQLNGNDQFTGQIRLVAPPVLGQISYEIDVSVTGYDSRGELHYWNNSGVLPSNGSLDLLVLSKEIGKATVYLKEYEHITLSIYNRGPVPINNIHIIDKIPDSLKYIQGKTELDNLSEISFNVNSIGADQSWTTDYLVRPYVPGIYVLPAFTANFTAAGIEFRNQSNDIGFRVYGPIVQVNKSVIDLGNNVLEIEVSANNIGNGPTRVIIDDTLPDNAILLTGSNHSSLSLNADEEKVINYTISIANIAKSGKFEFKNLPPAYATYYLGDYEFKTSSSENVMEIAFPTSTEIVTAGIGNGTEAGNVENVTSLSAGAVPAIQEAEKKVVATIPATRQMTTEEKSPGFDFGSLIVIFIFILFIYGKK